MSQSPYQDPSQYDPNLNFASPGAAPAKTRPGAISGLAITGIVLGSLGVLCNGYGVAISAIMFGNGGKNPLAGPASPAYSSTFVNISLLGAVVGLLLWIALIAGCVAALGLRPIGRRGLLVWSLAMLLWQLVSLVLQIGVVVPESVEAMKRMQASQPQNPMAGQMSGMMGGMMIGSAVFVWVVCSILPILFLAMWTRPRIKAAFEAGLAPHTPMPPPYSPMP